MAKNFRIVNEDYQKVISKVVDQAGKGMFSFMNEARKNAEKYVPEDTGSIKSCSYIVRNKTTIAIGFGSNTGDETLNKIVIYQHENELNHFGFPKGGSMRQGVKGANIPGQKWAVAGKMRTIKGNPDLMIQFSHYQMGYLTKKKTGQLTKYKSEFLVKGINDTLSGWRKHFGKSIVQ